MQVTCGGLDVAENTCNKQGSSYTVVCSCGDGSASVTQSAFAMGDASSPFDTMFARRFGPMAARDTRPQPKMMMMRDGRGFGGFPSPFDDVQRDEVRPFLPRAPVRKTRPTDNPSQ